GGLALLKGGTTTFLEAGTVRHLDHIADGLRHVGIRARISNWIEGRAFDPSENETALFDRAIEVMQEQVAQFPERPDDLVAAWPILVGHNTNPDAVWQAAKQIAKAAGVGIAAHMSPYDVDPQWYLSNVGARPMVHLEGLGVMDARTTITHATYLDAAECDVFNQTGASIAFCPIATLKGGFGAAKHSAYAELFKIGVNITFATDNYEAEILQAARVGVGVIKDLDATVVHMNAADGLAAITIRAAQALGLDHDIGSLEVGKAADMVSFNTRTPQWQPLISPLDQLIWGADGRTIDRVWVAGKERIANGRSVDIDEDALLDQVQAASKAILARADLPFKRNWSIRRA
ncbi:MAG: amidohydrolase family protein, partial [Pseudomonadota bacterium]